MIGIPSSSEILIFARMPFGLPETEKTVDTCIIVLEVEMENEVTVIGAIADSVREVFEINTADIEPPPRIGTRFETEFISGMGKHNDNFIIILDVNKVFSSHELDLFRHADKGSSETLSEPHHIPDEMPLIPEEPLAGAAKEEETITVKGNPWNATTNMPSPF